MHLLLQPVQLCGDQLVALLELLCGEVIFQTAVDVVAVVSDIVAIQPGNDNLRHPDVQQEMQAQRLPGKKQIRRKMRTP